MPDAPLRAQRVRTGCLTCRKRRRKCDEAKPVCQNCVGKSLSCRYGLDVKFLASHPSRSRRAHGRGQGNCIEPADYSNLTFIQVPQGLTSHSHSPSLSHSPHTHTTERPSRSDTATPTEDGGLPQSVSAAPPNQQDVDVASPIVLPDDVPPPSALERGPVSPGLPLSDSYNSFGPPSSSTCSPSFSVPLQGRISSGTPGTLTGQPDPTHSAHSARSAHVDHTRERYEIELLTYYRYHIAPRLDLGVGSSYFGIRALHRAGRGPPLCHSILALASCHRALSDSSHRQVDEERSGQYSILAEETFSFDNDEDQLTSAIILTLRDMTLSRPSLWNSRVAALQRTCHASEGTLLEEHWQVMARLALAARLAESAASHDSVDLSSITMYASPVPGSQFLTPKQQLGQSFALLARALTISKSGGASIQDSGQTPRLPWTATWQSCWSDSQLWYWHRSEQMQQIFEVEHFDSILPGRRSVEPDGSSSGSSGSHNSSTPFPVILFSNNCALLANLVHHLTALYLLHHKPRLLKAVAEIGSSASPVWHAQRLVGIVASFTEPEILDPLVVMAVLYAAKKLSHPAQLACVVDILGKALRSTGMQLQDEIHGLGSAYLP